MNRARTATYTQNARERGLFVGCARKASSGAV